MGLLSLKKKKTKRQGELLPLPVTASNRILSDYLNPYHKVINEFTLFEEIKENIPIINAAVSKIIRLIGDFRVKSDNQFIEKELQYFIDTVKVNGLGIGIENFLSTYLEQLLIYGTTVGEIVLDRENHKIEALYNTNINDIILRYGKNPLEVDILVKNDLGIGEKVADTSLIFSSSLNPKGASPYGESILKGLPFISEILMKIYESIGKNWKRAGDLRFAVTYKPEKDASQRAFSKQRAEVIASEWSKAMNTDNGVSDFIAIGDVEIKVIGADNPILDSSVPVKQLMEQIVAKLGIPPFLLGLSWSTTERMSSQQADILTSELEYYRRKLTPIIRKICDTHLRCIGYIDDYELEWKYINLQDEEEMSNARLTNAQAEKLEIENEKSKAEILTEV